VARSAERSVRDLRIVVTGATDGIGKEIARGLVDRGAVTIVARNPAKAEATVRELTAAGVTPPEVVLADLSDMSLARPLEYGPIGAQMVYGRSKLMNVLSTAELARRLAGTDVTVNCFCPGFVATSLSRDLGDRTLRLSRLVSRTPLLRRPEQGARMGLRLVLDPALFGVSGQFFTSTPGAGLLPAVASRGDVPLQRELWNASAALVGVAG
jgi:NAD(P)-dependent dehydrogenase (short-subunit alcohol dehydrogenase family)